MRIFNILTFRDLARGVGVATADDWNAIADHIAELDQKIGDLQNEVDDLEQRLEFSEVEVLDIGADYDRAKTILEANDLDTWHRPKSDTFSEARSVARLPRPGKSPRLE